MALAVLLFLFSRKFALPQVLVSVAIYTVSYFQTIYPLSTERFHNEIFIHDYSN